ncbi:PAS domain-containing protein [Henriciella barbarensis]|uniref:histidine kinase n=1 Tax=Henriciella barbarensis TaxID=86342 RepID=A0A399QS87_9PROT|nr:PAS domain-containing sensor histidine kinase [Henriciella barbarensis]RIJ20532.1 PAS domain-containing protein [Henriciella barbarensis]
MAKRTDSEKRPKRSAEGRAASPAVLVVTFAILAASIAMVAWNAQTTRDANALRLAERDALLTAHALNAAADRTAEQFNQLRGAGRSVGSIDASDIGVDSVISIQAAGRSNDQRNRELANRARDMIASGLRMRVTPNNEIMLVHALNDGSGIISRASFDKWLTGANASQRIILSGDRTVSIGGENVLPPNAAVLNGQGNYRWQGLTNRSLTACSDVAGANFRLCLNRSGPLLTQANALQFLLYAILLGAPALAVFGLYRTARGARPETEEAQREAPGVVRVATAAENSQVGAWQITPEAGKVWINDQTARLFGLQLAGELHLSEFMDQVFPEHRENFQRAIDACRSGKPMSVDVATKMSRGETWVEFRGSMDRLDHSAQPTMSGVVFDVTEVVRQRERQRSSEARLRLAIESFPCPFALWDNRRRLTFWNKAFAQLFQLEDVVRVGVAYETIMLARTANTVSERGSEEDPNTTIVGLSTGQWIKVVERRSPAGGVITFGLDVTQDVKSEDELIRQKKKLSAAVQELARSEGHNAELAHKYNEEKAKAERSADSKSAFLANMSHELRTPLNAINGFSEILVNEMYGALGDERYRDYARDILTSGQHLLDMINDILDIAKIEAGKMTIDPKPIDLVDPVDAAVRMIRRKAEEKSVDLSLQAPDNLPEVDADHRAVRQMVLNLLSNAIKFTDEGGKVIVAVQDKGDFVRVAVRDTGVGIPKEHLPRLAQPFEQVHETRERNYEGTGLGLALTKSFAEMHGGRLSIASEVGKGTMVSFYLPVSKTTARPSVAIA